MTYVVGITGGIGSGKTAVSDRLKQLGISVADADVIARAIVAPGQEVLEKISQHFGDSIIQPDGFLDRSALRDLVFRNKNERKWLESVTHPAIIEGCQTVLASSTSEYAVLVLSAGTGKSPLMNRLLVVDTTAEKQMQRVMERDNNNREQVEAIMQSQLSREDRLTYADDVILNDGSLEVLQQKVDRLHGEYLKLAQIHNKEAHNKEPHNNNTKSQ